MPRTIVIVIGTRPEAIKLAPLILTLKRQPEFNTVVISTAQHRHMLDQVLSVFRISPDIDLDVMQPRQDLAALTSRLLERMRDALARTNPNLLVVQGDTTTALAAALAAFYARVPVAHVEAGLRSHDLANPFPEEANRKLASVLADVHFAPTPGAKAALVREGVAPSRIAVTGNTVVDALELVVARHAAMDPPVASYAPERAGRLMLLTSHRRESFGPELEQICTAAIELVQRFSDLTVVYPVHLNPQVRETVTRMLEGIERIQLIEPLDYLAFINLMRRATLIVTDSGGVQEEAPTLRKPLLVLRKVTERPEAFEAGLSRVIGTSRDVIVAEVSRLLTDQRAFDSMVSDVNPYGDGRAAERIAQALHRWAAGKAAPWLTPVEEFDCQPDRAAA